MSTFKAFLGATMHLLEGKAQLTGQICDTCSLAVEWTLSNTVLTTSQVTMLLKR